MMNVAKIFSMLLLCSVFTLSAEPTVEKKELTAKQKKELGKRLIYAAENGTYEQVKECLDAGADINFRGEEYSETALHWSVCRGDVGITRLLIERGADVNARNVDGNTPLNIVVIQHKIGEKIRLQIMKILLEVKDINVNNINNYGRTALFWAAFNGSVQEVYLLLEHGADINIADNKGKYPFYVFPYDKIYSDKESKSLKDNLKIVWYRRFFHWLKY